MLRAEKVETPVVEATSRHGFHQILRTRLGCAVPVREGVVCVTIAAVNRNACFSVQPQVATRDLQGEGMRVVQPCGTGITLVFNLERGGGVIACRGGTRKDLHFAQV